EVVYEIGRREPFLDKTGKIKTKDGKPGVALDWFNMLYQVLLGQAKGPRFGSFVAVYGLKNTVDMIDGALARSAELIFVTPPLPQPRQVGNTGPGSQAQAEMSPADLAVIAATIVFSSFVSGVFGMAGGMVLLGVLLNYLDVAAGMILFSIIQFFANGWRVVQWRHYVLWPIFGWYLLCAAISFAFMLTMAFVPDKAMVYLALGLMPFVIEVMPAALRPNIERRGVPFFTGMVTTVIQILAGVGGLFLDIFFQKSMLDRKTTNATKAVAQTFS